TGRLAVENVLGESEHVFRNLNIADTVEVGFFPPNLVREPERRAEQALSPWLEHDDALALGQNHPAQPDHALAAHRVADHRKRLQRDLVLRNQIVGAVDVALVDFGFWYEAIDVDRVAALDCYGVQLFVFDAQVKALIDLVAASLVSGFYGIARIFVDQLLAKAVARFHSPPAPTEKDLAPGAEIPGVDIGGNAYVAEIAGAIAGGNVHAAAERDREVREVAADADAFVHGIAGATGRARIRVTEADFSMNEI